MGDSPREGRSNAGAYIAIAIGVGVVLIGFLAIVVMFLGFGRSSGTIVSPPMAPVAVPATPAPTSTPAPAVETPPSEQK